MAHYAFINNDGIVVEVITGKDENEDGLDWEVHYAQLRGMTCKRTSYNTSGNVHANGGQPFRKNYAGRGFTYDYVRDAFIPPQPFPSWSLDEDTCLWCAPIPMPSDGNIHEWDEAIGQWVNTAAV